MKKYLNWYNKIIKKNKSRVVIKSLNKCKNWVIGQHNIKHKSGLFFKVIGIKVLDPYERETNLISWEQPLIEEVKFGSGLIGMIIKIIDNKIFFLIQAKFEPGNIFNIQISPTVQSTFSNIKYNSKKTKFLNYFQSNLLKSKLPRTRISTVFKKWVSEDGGRFYKKKNLIHIIKVSHNEQINLPENYIWIDETNLVKLNLLKKPIVNCHVRSILSFTGYFKRLS
jgi:oxidase EvaA